MKPARVLFVEDSPIHVKLILHHLKDAGYDVTFARGYDLPSLAKAIEDASWQLAIIDYKLPGWDGLQALKYIKSCQPGVECIVTSGVSGREIEDEALAAGARAYVGKISLSRLIDVAREVLDAR